jgi:hypothetical protein
MQPQTKNAATIAQKITNGISCIVIVVFSVAPNTTTSHYKTFGVSSLAQYLWQPGNIRRNPSRFILRQQLGR